MVKVHFTKIGLFTTLKEKYKALKIVENQVLVKSKSKLPPSSIALKSLSQCSHNSGISFLTLNVTSKNSMT